MSDPFVAEIRIVGFNFAPLGWALCNGQILPISQNTALFSLLGTNYGGDGKSTFGLPNLQGSVPIHAGGGQGPGLSPYVVGQTGGKQTVTLLSSQLPAHTHGAQFSTTAGSLPSPTNNAWAKPPGGGHGQPAAEQAYSTNAPNAAMSGAALSSVGGGLPHNNMSPYVVMNFVIAMQGIYPARS